MDLNHCSDSVLVQTDMELPLEEKARELFEPPRKLQLIYHINGLNLPAVGKYNTPVAIGLIKQEQGYSHWYDRRKIQLKEDGNACPVLLLRAAGRVQLADRPRAHQAEAGLLALV